jgi:dTDP-4-amino-4,6-dideoxygalactose transaminase
MRFWRLVPRYHPRVCPAQIALAAFRRPAPPEGLFPASAGLREGEGLFFVNRGMTGLVLALKALDLPPGSAIAVPLYACVTVFEAIAAAGHRCLFIDVEPESFSFDLECLRRHRNEAAAAILIHTFGLPGDVAAAREALGGKPIIEDCAHALGSTAGGMPLGLRGEAAVFSFNFSKPICATGGGAICTKDPVLAGRIRQMVQVLPLGRRLPFRTLMGRCAEAGLYRPPWYGLLVAAGLLSLHREGAYSATVTPGRMSTAERVLLAGALPGFTQRILIQRQWVGEVLRRMGPLPPAAVGLRAGDDWNAHLCPVLLPTVREHDEALAHFHRNSVDAYHLWPECLRTAARFGYQASSCPRLEEALPRLLFLPCYPELSPAQRVKILRAIDTWRR